MAFETGLEGKPWYVAAAVGLGLLLAVVFAAKYFSIDGINKQTERRERELTGLEEEIQKGRSAQRTLPQFREEVRRLELELDKLLRVLPSRRNTEDLLRRLRTLMEQGDFNFLRFTPRAQQDRDFYSEWPIQIRLDGDYHNLALLFDRISRFSRIINIEDLVIRTKRDSTPDETINGSFTMKTFLYTPPEEELGEDEV
ncbi:MAG: type 4a pilus biogenesis protein PilO [Acidobacteriota bacterium]